MSKKPSTRQIGKWAETRAEIYLRFRGYRVLARNVLNHGGELDFVCKHKGELVFVEVRSRANTQFGHPAETIGHKKQQRLLRAANHYLNDSGWQGPCRFDVVTLVGRKIELLTDCIQDK